MNKLLLILLGASLLCCPQAKGQRYIRSQKALQLTIGTTDGYLLIANRPKAFHAEFSMSSCTANGNRWMYGLGYQSKSYEDLTGNIPVAQFTAQAGYLGCFLSNRTRSFSASVGVEAVVGYETVDWGIRRLPDGGRILSKDAFIYGGAAVLELEWMLAEQFILLLSAKERVLYGSSEGVFHTQVGIGLKIVID